mmetsp:Transcript_4625/g.12999  ORF Transcript_4625/g.12999 Transcript_4625/m.12999 type:complete len:83 (-) Transcript_4625:153-401(-)
MLHRRERETIDHGDNHDRGVTDAGRALDLRAMIRKGQQWRNDRMGVDHLSERLEQRKAEEDGIEYWRRGLTEFMDQLMNGFG